MSHTTPFPLGRGRPRPVAPSGVRAAASTATAVLARQPYRFFFVVLLAWLGFEFGRPSNPFGGPLLCSAVLLGGWLVRSDKRWTPQSWWLVALLVVMALSIPFAPNTYAAFWTTYGMAVTLLSICVPLPSLVRSLGRIRTWLYTFLAISFYVGAWAMFHDGFGPSGAGGGQDENYVATMMGMAVAVAYFSIFAEKRLIVRLLLAGTIAVSCGAMVAADNASRGGFLGLCAVIAYCVARSPRKMLGLALVVVIALGVLAFAGAKYWEEIATITDTNEGTADVRLEIWKAGLRIWAANPVVGVGAGGFRWAIGEYQSADQFEKFGRSLGGSIIAHSLYVELLAELGSAGGLVLIGILWRTWKDLRLVIRDGTARAGAPASDEAQAIRCYADAVTAAILACLVNGVFLSLLYFSYLWLFLALAGAIVLVSRSLANQPATARSTA